MWRREKKSAELLTETKKQTNIISLYRVCVCVCARSILQNNKLYTKKQKDKQTTERKRTNKRTKNLIEMRH